MKFQVAFLAICLVLLQAISIQSSDLPPKNARTYLARNLIVKRSADPEPQCPGGKCDPPCNGVSCRRDADGPDPGTPEYIHAHRNKTKV